jgi:hypothetical protein
LIARQYAGKLAEAINRWIALQTGTAPLSLEPELVDTCEEFLTSNQSTRIFLSLVLLYTQVDAPGTESSLSRYLLEYASALRLEYQSKKG